MFVARGLSQKKRFYFKYTFALIARYTSIKIIMSIALVFGCPLYQMNVKTTFS